MKLIIRHHLTEADAKFRIQALLNKIKKDYSKNISSISEIWGNGRGTFSFTASGFKVVGSVQISYDQVIIDIKLPITALMFQNKIKTEVMKEVNKSLQ